MLNIFGHRRGPQKNAGPRVAPAWIAPELEREPDRHPLDFGLVRWIFSYTRPYARKRNVLLAMVFTRSAQLPLLAWATGRIIDGPIAHRSAGGLFWAALGWLGLVLFTQLVLHFRQRYALELGEAVVHDLRSDVFAHLQRMQMSFYNVTKLGRTISRMTSDAEAVRAGVQDVLFCSLVAGGQMLVAGGLMAWADWTSCLVLAALAPGLWIANRCLRRKLGDAYHEVQESYSKVTSCVAESIQGIQVTQGAARQEVNARRFRDLVAFHGENNLRTAQLAGVFQPLLELNSQIFLCAVLVLGGYRVLGPGHATLGDLIQFLFLTGVFFQPIQTIGDQYNQALLAMAGAERLRRLLATPPDWTDPPQARRLPALAGAVRFDNVSFGYRDDRRVLHNIRFTAEAGQMIALVGHTGSGKTSVINLLAKLYLPNSGRVLLDGHDIAGLDTDWLRGQIGIVLQQNFLFSGTVLDNILVGRRDARRDDSAAAARSRACQVLQRLGCLDLFEALPDRLDTEVGEAGSLLSVGQRQLVCFARALLADPRILILDEATSSVDLFTERRIQQALSELLRGRTSFVVAHRLSTIRSADLVLVFDNGRIIERGTHRDLIEREGAYNRLHQRTQVA